MTDHGAGAGGGPHVKVFSGLDGSVMSSFFAYNASIASGVRVAVADLNNDGFPELVTSSGIGAMTSIRSFDLATPWKSVRCVSLSGTN